MRNLGLWDFGDVNGDYGTDEVWEMMRLWGYEIVRRVQRSSLLAFHHAATAATKLLQSCPTLCDPRDGSPPGSPIPGILQARTLEWVAISFSKAWKWKVKVKSLSHVWLLATPWTAAYQAPPIHGIFQARVLEWGAIAFSAIWEFNEKTAICNQEEGLYHSSLGVP